MHRQVTSERECKHEKGFKWTELKKKEVMTRSVGKWVHECASRQRTRVIAITKVSMKGHMRN